MQTQLIIGWPALLTLERASQYLSLERNAFLMLAERWNVCPVEADTEELLWRIKDLDALVRRLPSEAHFRERIGHAVPLRLDTQTLDLIAQAVSARLEAKPVGSGLSEAFLVSVKDAAKQLGLGRSKIYRMISEGSLRVKRLGGRTLVTQESIQSLLNE